MGRQCLWDKRYQLWTTYVSVPLRSLIAKPLDSILSLIHFKLLDPLFGDAHSAKKQRTLQFSIFDLTMLVFKFLSFFSLKERGEIIKIQSVTCREKRFLQLLTSLAYWTPVNLLKPDPHVRITWSSGITKGEEMLKKDKSSRVSVVIFDLTMNSAPRTATWRRSETPDTLAYVYFLIFLITLHACVQTNECTSHDKRLSTSFSLLVFVLLSDFLDSIDQIFFNILASF